MSAPFEYHDHPGFLYCCFLYLSLALLAAFHEQIFENLIMIFLFLTGSF